MKNPTFAHLRNPEFTDSDDRDPRSKSGFVTEYGLTACQFPADFSWLSKLIYADANERKDFLWIPDANMAIRSNAAPVWEAFQKAFALDYKPQCLLLPAVEAELTEWLDEPYRNKELANAIRSSLERGTGFCRQTRADEFSPSDLRLVDYYISLLVARRRLALPLDNGKTILAVDASNKSLAMSKVSEFHGPRGKMFARSGRDDLERRGVINANDESIVALAFMTSLVGKQHVCILTTDRHVLDSFYKFQWFLDTHYRSYLVGQMIANGYYESCIVEPTSAMKHCFDGDCTFYKKRSWCFDEVLRTRDEYYSFEVMHFEETGTVNWIRFKWEPELLGMLRNKLADGRNSTIFGDHNVHIATSPLGESVGSHIIVGRDRMIPRQNESAIPIGLLDFQHAINSQERHTTVASSVINLRSDREQLDTMR